MTEGRLVIDMLIPRYPPWYSGAGRQARELARYLHERGADVRVIALLAEPPAASEEDPYPVVRLEPRGSERGRVIAYGLRAPTIARSSATWYVAGSGPQLWLILLMSWLRGTRVVFKATMEGHDDAASLVSGRVSLARRLLLRRVSAFVGVSTSLYDGFRNSHTLSDRAARIPNAVDVARFRPAADSEEREALRASLGIPIGSYVVLYSGALVSRKNPQMLVRAWSRIASTDAGARLVLVVPEPPCRHASVPLAYAPVLAAVDASPSGERIAFIENPERIEEVYRAADVFCLPSVQEGLSNSCLEAMSSGLPVIACESSGMRDLIEPDVSGVLVRCAEEDIADAVARLRDDSLRSRLGGQARDRAERLFSTNVVFSQYVQLFEAVHAAGRR